MVFFKKKEEYEKVNAKEEIIDRIIILEDLKNKKVKPLKQDKKNYKQRIYKGYTLKPKLYFTFFIYLILILLFMTLPLLFILLFEGI